MVRIPLFGAVEGLVDEAVLRRLIYHAGGTPETIYGKNGKQALRLRIYGYNRAARHYPWVVLADLNGEEECAPLLLNAWNLTPARWMCFRIAVREIEAWLMADRERFARFLSVHVNRVPEDPESLPDPKRMVVEIARQSRRADIRLDIVPPPGRDTGPAYTSRMIQFTEDRHYGWRPEAAQRRSASLQRSLRRIRELAAAYRRFASGAM
jgi:hypothetical protein